MAAETYAMGERCSTRRVVHVIEPAPHGGAETVVWALAAGARRRGDQPLVAALVQGPGEPPLVARLRSDGVAARTIQCGRRRYLAEATALAAVLAQHGADLVHTHVYHADVVGYLAARRCDVPIVATVHGLTGGGWKNRFYEWLDLRVLRRFDAVMCVSESVADRARRAGVPAPRVRLVPNAFAGAAALDRPAARRALGLPTDAAVIGWIGRLSFEKGPDRFVDAVRSLVGAGTLAVLIGEGPERDALTSRVGMASEAIRLLGAHPVAGTLVRAFDVLAITSRTEGLPITLLEAMAARVPVVAFAVGGLPGVLDSGSAWLVPEGDLDALRAAIRDALADRVEAAHRAAAAEAILRERFGEERWLDAVARIYDEVMP